MGGPRTGRGRLFGAASQPEHQAADERAAPQDAHHDHSPSERVEVTGARTRREPKYRCSDADCQRESSPKGRLARPSWYLRSMTKGTVGLAQQTGCFTRHVRGLSEAPGYTLRPGGDRPNELPHRRHVHRQPVHIRATDYDRGLQGLRTRTRAGSPQPVAGLVIRRRPSVVSSVLGAPGLPPFTHRSRNGRAGLSSPQAQPDTSLEDGRPKTEDLLEFQPS